MSFSDWIKDLMQQNELNASALARALNVKPSAVSHWTNNKRLPDDPSIESLSEYFDFDLKEILLMVHKAKLIRVKK